MCLKSKKTINRFFTLFTYFLSAMPLMNTPASFSQVSGGTAYNGLLSVELSPVGIAILKPSYAVFYVIAHLTADISDIQLRTVHFEIVGYHSRMRIG